MKHNWLTIVFLLCSIFPLHADKEMTSLLKELDHTIREREVYRAEKEKRIGKWKDLLQHALPAEQQLEICEKLFYEYLTYNTDSCIFYAEEELRVATVTDNPYWITKAKMSLVEVMTVAGMTKEAFDLLESMDRERLAADLYRNYYHLYRTLYDVLANYAVTTKEQAYYTHMTTLYRDSLLHANVPGTFNYMLVEADELIVNGRGKEAIALLSGQYDTYKDNVRSLALMAYVLSEAYRIDGDRANEKKYLVISSIADLQLAVREYISLRNLAMFCYQEGDIERAYNYLKCSLDDAIACNARIRTLEISKIFPIIDTAYQTKARKQRSDMEKSLISISLLSFFLLIAIFYVYRQMKKLSVARKEVIDTNLLLQQVNKELSGSNKRLKEMNNILSETNFIKEEYVGRYMDLCSVYLDKLDTYRRSLGKLAAAGKPEDVYKALKSSAFIDEELKEFYAGFDSSFLRLFPTFVDDFNALLSEGEKIQLKPGERMNTELRIFALVRLGITDSAKIAQFLRYSVTTIYNYRTKARNRAAGERDDFENKVMKIGVVTQ
ncbi:MAG: DUF6377 domain-containing protein [Tannerellaceae bacterium]|nr:DUF6377 domain-containing protein [Tannerellaceae bacterium]